MDAAKKQPDIEDLEKGLSVEEMLQNCILFQGASAEALAFISSTLKPMEVESGEPIFLENEVSDCVYFVQSGAVEILGYSPEVKQVSRIAILEPGSHFSEFSVLTKATKSASAFAHEDCNLLTIDGETFMKILRSYPVIAKNLALRLADINYNFNLTHFFVERYRADEIEYNQNITQLLPVNQWERHHVLPLNFRANSLSIAMEDPYDTKFFQFFKGFQPQVQLNISFISDLEFQDLHSHLKSMYTKNVHGHEELKPKTKPPKYPDIKSFMHAQTLFKKLPDQLLDQILPIFQKQSFKAGDIIIKPNDPAQEIYFIETGAVEISRPYDSQGGHVMLGTRHQLECFGDVEVINNKPFVDYIKAIEDTNVYKLNQSVVQQLYQASDFTVQVSKRLAKLLSHRNEHSGLKYFHDEEHLQLDELATIIPHSVMADYKVLPLVLKGDELTVGVVNQNESVYSVVGRYLLDYRIKLEQISESNFKTWFKQVEVKLKKPPSGARVSPAQAAATKVTPLKSPTKILDEIILDAFTRNVSDVHIEPFVTEYSVRYRIDGVLQERDEKIPAKIGEEMVNRIKVLAKLDISNHFTPQDGQIKTKIDGTEINARVSIAPTKHGENCVLRLIKPSTSIIPLSMLAPDRRTIQILKAAVKAKQGLFLITGPTGSGKTTTLYSMLNELNHVDIKVITLENPVELDIEGLTQIEVNEKAGMTFAQGLKSALRQDPDVIMVGEVRDEESAKIVFDAAMTGHLVLSTLHTNSSLEVGPRLRELGVSPVMLASGMIGVVAQRLLRKICMSCRSYRPISKSEKDLFSYYVKKSKPPETVVYGRGCQKCRGSGYTGRLPVYEIWRKTHEASEILARDGTVLELTQAVRDDGFLSLAEFGLLMVLAGLTTVEEVKRCLSEI